MVHWLKKRRLELGMTQDEIVRALALQGIEKKRSAIAMWENGENTVSLLSSPDEAKALAGVLGWTLTELLVAAGYEIDVCADSYPPQALEMLRLLRYIQPNLIPPITRIAEEMYKHLLATMPNFSDRELDDSKPRKEHHD